MQEDWSSPAREGEMNDPECDLLMLFLLIFGLVPPGLG